MRGQSHLLDGHHRLMTISTRRSAAVSWRDWVPKTARMVSWVWIDNFPIRVKHLNLLSEIGAFWEPCQTFRMERCTKIVNGWKLRQSLISNVVEKAKYYLLKIVTKNISKNSVDISELKKFLVNSRQAF